MTSEEARSVSRRRTVDGLIEGRAVAVIRLRDSSKLMDVVEAIRAGGVRSVEITMTVPGALEQISVLGRALGDEILLGVGSVLDAETARRAVDAGARYVVSPVLRPEVIAEAHKFGAAALPGCFSPSELQRAHEGGADIIKVFPADVVGMPFFRAVLAPMPHLRLMPTGGVTLDNAGDWLRAGACAVGVGSALLDRSAIADGRYEVLTQNARRLMESLSSAS